MIKLHTNIFHEFGMFSFSLWLHPKLRTTHYSMYCSLVYYYYYDYSVVKLSLMSLMTTCYKPIKVF